jgi:hypothetical protein
LKEEVLDRIKWRNRLGRGCGPVVWQITDDDDGVFVCVCARALARACIWMQGRGRVLARL